MVNFKKKFLSFYKNGNDLNHLSKKELIKKYTDLKKEHEELLAARRNETTAKSFCNWSFVDFYFRDDFEEKFHEMVKDLPWQSKSYFKWLFLRILAVNYSGRNTLFLDDELRDQKVFTEFQKNNVSEGKVGDFKFKGEFNLHGFIDLKLTNDDKEFLKNKDIIDAGAFTGDTALPLSKITNKNVYAFEPFKESYNLLKGNIEANKLSNVCAVNKSLGDINGERTLYLSDDNFQGITSDANLREYSEELKVEEVTVDQFVSENDLDVGLITIDVEGAEQNLLKGALDTIKSQKPLLFISIYHNVADFFEIKPWIQSLDLGYEFEIVKEQPWTFVADTVLQCRPY